MEIKRCYDTIVGASVVENQLVNIKASGGVGGVSFTFNSTTGEISFSGTATSSYMGDLQSANANIIGNYIYLLKPTVVANPNNISFGIGYLNVIYGSVNINSAKIIKPSADRSSTVGIDNYSAGTVFDGVKVKFNTIDLTAELGSAIADYIYSLESATAGSGIAKLREWGFLKGYQAFNAGSIESVEVTEKKVVGFNQWDEEWELGVYTSADGQPVSTTTNVRSKSTSYIPVIPNATYYFNTSGKLMEVYRYDADKNYISKTNVTDQTLTIDGNVRYIRFDMASAYGTTYNHDICINLSNQDRNGEYEAYSEQTYDYGDDTLRGIFKLDANNQLYADGDVKTSDGTITRRYKDDDMGTLNWTYWQAQSLFYVEIPTKAQGINNFITSIYPTLQSGGYGELSDKQIVGSQTSSYIYVKETSYTDAASFKAAMSGVMLVYELATPITEQGDPFPSPQVCYPDGTEEYVTSNGVPVGHETRYEL